MEHGFPAKFSRGIYSKQPDFLCLGDGYGNPRGPLTILRKERQLIRLARKIHGDLFGENGTTDSKKQNHAV